MYRENLYKRPVIVIFIIKNESSPVINGKSFGLYYNWPDNIDHQKAEISICY
jgi:hypothetical protein